MSLVDMWGRGLVFSTRVPSPYSNGFGFNVCLRKSDFSVESAMLLRFKEDIVDS